MNNQLIIQQNTRLQRGMSINRIAIGILITISLLAVITEQTPIVISLTPNRTFCFNQDMPKHTLMKLDVSSRGMPYMLQIMFLRQVLYNLTTSQNTTKSMTTQKFGIYRICFTNLAQTYNALTFEFLTGVQAKDYSSHTQSSDYIGSLENQAKIAELFINQIQQQNRAGLEIMNQNQVKYNKYSIQYFFSVIFIGVIMLLSYGQFVLIRNHMINRKYI